MTRLTTVNRQTTDSQTAQLLDGVEKKLGIVPNLLSTMAQSTAVANGYLGFSGALASGELSASIREQIALAVGQQNSCDYCVSAHSVVAAGAGLDEDTVIAARHGQSSDARTDAILKFAKHIVESRGNVTDADVDALKDQGLSEGEIAEVVANVALNIFTNYFNHVADTELDFPKAAELPTAVACNC